MEDKKTTLLAFAEEILFDTAADRKAEKSNSPVDSPMPE
jgi:hypothetical protein